MTSEVVAPGLDDLRRELEAVGMVVVPFGDEIHIRRSTLEYIKVRIDGGTLRCEPWIGALSQAKATWSLLAMEMVVVAALLYQIGTAPAAVVVAFGGLLGFGFHSLRYVLSEIVISRVQAVWLDLQQRHRALTASSSLSLPSPTVRALGEGSAPAREESKPEQVRSRT